MVIGYGHLRRNGTEKTVGSRGRVGQETLRHADFAACAAASYAIWQPVCGGETLKSAERRGLKCDCGD